jgi:hypothetical protein
LKNASRHTRRLRRYGKIKSMAPEAQTMPTQAKKTVATTLPHDELAALDRVRDRQRPSRAGVVREAIRWYVGAMRHLPAAEEPSRTYSKLSARARRNLPAARPDGSKTYCMSWSVELAHLMHGAALEDWRM